MWSLRGHAPRATRYLERPRFGGARRLQRVANSRIAAARSLLSYALARTIGDADTATPRARTNAFARVALMLSKVSDAEEAAALSREAAARLCFPAQAGLASAHGGELGGHVERVERNHQRRDSADKQELDPRLIASHKVVVDLLDQCEMIGELHHALERGLLNKQDIHAELGEVIAGEKPGRTSDDEIIIFDSTGTALQDVAAAAIVFERAMSAGVGLAVNFDDKGPAV